MVKSRCPEDRLLTSGYADTSVKPSPEAPQGRRNRTRKPRFLVIDNTIYEILLQSGGDHFAGISSLLRHPKEIFEELEREFDAAHKVIQAEEVERRESTGL